jgi:hypothetical protein
VTFVTEHLIGYTESQQMVDNSVRTVMMICEDCDDPQHHCTCKHCNYEHIAHEK